MNLQSLMQMIPGMGSSMSVKHLLEIFSARIIKHVGHPVDKYQMRMIFATGFMEFLVFHPGPNVPDVYQAPKNLQFKNVPRPETPNNSRWYDMDVNSGMGMIRDFIKTQVKDFDGELDFIIANVNRDSKEVPCIIGFTENGIKKRIEKILK